MTKRRNPVVRRVQPEHIRQDIEPAAAGKSKFHDEHGMPVVNKRSVRKMPPPDPVPNTPVRIRAKHPDQPQFAPPKRGQNVRRAKAVPPQPMAHVGMNQDQMWFDHHVIGEAAYEDDQEMIDNNEEMDIESVDKSGMVAEPTYERWYGNNGPGDRRFPVEDLSALESEVEKLEADDQFNYDFSDEATERFRRGEEPYQEPSEPEPDLALNFAIQKGEYAVLLKNQLVVKNTDVAGIKSVVEDMILTHDIDVKDITVLKSIPIDFGVLLKDE